MKITIKKEYTHKYEMDTVKADIQEFKEYYTEGYLLRQFIDTLDANGIETPYMHSADITVCNIEAFPGGTYYADENGRQPTHYSVSMTVDNGFSEIDKIHFYTDNALQIRLTAYSFGETINMYSIERYILKK